MSIFSRLSQIAVLIPLVDTQKFNVKVGRCDPLFLLGIMYPQKVLHRLGDLRRGIKVLLNRFGDGFGDGFRVYNNYSVFEEHLDWKGCHGIEIPAFGRGQQRSHKIWP